MRRPQPDAELIREAIANDLFITRITQRHEEAEAARVTEVRAAVEKLSQELAEYCAQRGELNRQIALRKKSLQALKRQAVKRKLPARFQRRITERKHAIRMQERERFLRQWKIEFDRETRHL